MSSLVLPAGYPRIRMVASFDELVSTPLADGVNALCWPRVLPGNYAEIAAALPAGEGISRVDDEQLAAPTLSEAGQIARGILLADQQLLRAHDLQPELNIIHGRERELTDEPILTDVYSFHADSATVETDTYLCTYLGASSEGLRNDEARRRVDVPATRTELLALHGGPDDAGFSEFLNENCYDLHHEPLSGARPFSFGLGNLWRLAVEWPGCPVPPCIHRAPLTLPGDPVRLLLIS